MQLAGASERDHLPERLQQIPILVPASAQEPERRQAAERRRENRRSGSFGGDGRAHRPANRLQ